ncbi:hypothetical protein EYZ11_003952 [Aspergillus tanneri]|uniref:Neutral protease 2 n=1 Tax=Aspergillus tanneri TaxID=1220188 RepID=A0A4S3JMB7_9EURO|nr:uncharacterized protein ATNIH1004_010943 [Aspergillus tanneri]KAA8642004.1 hypothetical protein ATNIH1004_010943 [Aspergillus tanneri]THC96560.1 hypothetical protein EYZ11_003952 [Aspergillus tanneri]
MRPTQVILAIVLGLSSFVTATPLDTRATLVHCTSDQHQMLQDALSQSSRMAKAGADTIRSGSNYGSALFQSFFKTNDERARSRVANILDQISEEALARGGGKVSYSCSPDGIRCSNPGESFFITAYGETNGYYGRIRTCPAYFSLVRFSNQCDRLDQATSSTHEMAHTKGIYGPETYGFYQVHQLDTATAMENAESYAFFAKSAFLNCSVH